MKDTLSLKDSGHKKNIMCFITNLYIDIYIDSVLK